MQGLEMVRKKKENGVTGYLLAGRVLLASSVLMGCCCPALPTVQSAREEVMELQAESANEPPSVPVPAQGQSY